MDACLGISRHQKRKGEMHDAKGEVGYMLHIWSGARSEGWQTQHMPFVLTVLFNSCFTLCSHNVESSVCAQRRLYLVEMLISNNYRMFIIQLSL